jgi:hypothetical protein
MGFPCFFHLSALDSLFPAFLTTVDPQRGAVKRVQSSHHHGQQTKEVDVLILFCQLRGQKSHLLLCTSSEFLFI